MKFRKMRFGKKFFAALVLAVFVTQIVTPAMAGTTHNSHIKITTPQEYVSGYYDTDDTYTVKTTSSTDVYGGAVNVTGTGSITSVLPKFIANKFAHNDDKTGGYDLRPDADAIGGAIYNSGQIDEITCSFGTSDTEDSGNTADANATATVNVQQGDYETKATATADATAYGGAIYNEGKIGKDDGIGGIIGTNFYYNKAVAKAEAHIVINYLSGEAKGAKYYDASATTTATASGGAIYISGSSSDIKTISASFEHNTATASTTTKIKDGTGGEPEDVQVTEATAEANAYGGAISISNGVKIGKIAGTNDARISFTANSAEVTSKADIDFYARSEEEEPVIKAKAYGGAIYNKGEIGEEDGTGGIIYTIFDQNSAITNGELNSVAYGGAIYNEGIIRSIAESTFTKNEAKAVNVSFQTVYGGAISNAGTITSIKANFDGNSAIAPEGWAHGGAIFNANSGTIGSIEGSFIRNDATAAGNYAYGGAISNRALSDGTFGKITSIKAIFDGNSASGSSAYGGAIHNEGAIGSDENTGITSSTFTKNKAQATEESWGEAHGGAIYNNSSSVTTMIITSITGSTFIGNCAEALKAESGAAHGGAIYNNGIIGKDDSTGGITGGISNSSFTGNSVTASGNGGNACGGAIFNANSGTIGSIEASFNNNKATTETGGASGGAIYNTNEITSIKASFKGNYASAKDEAYGGAIYSNGTIGSITAEGASIDNPTFMCNHVEATDGEACGGAIYNNYGTITSIKASFKGNYASATDEAYGGAIYNGNNTIESIEGSTFVDNEAKASGEGGYVVGGAIYNNDTIESIEGSTFVGNEAKASGEDGYAEGGAIYNNDTVGKEDGTGGIINATFKNNKTEVTGAITGDDPDAGSHGGAIFNYGSITSIMARFESNSVAASTYAYGGAIYNEKYYGEITSIKASFEGNKAEATGANGVASGGAIYNYEVAKITSIEARFEDNSAIASGRGGIAYGGAIYNYGGYESDGQYCGGVTSIKASFTGNSVTASGDGGKAYGGAIYNYGSYEKWGDAYWGKIESIVGSFDGNSATATGEAGEAYGGAIYNGKGGEIGGITDSSFKNNKAEATAKAYGGAIYTGSSLLIKAENKDVTFSGNKVSGTDAKGSAIYVETPTEVADVYLCNVPVGYLYSLPKAAILDGAGREMRAEIPNPSTTTLTLNAATGKKITFDNDQTIEGLERYSVDIKGLGTVAFKQDKTASFKNAGIYGATVTVSDGATLALYGSAGIFDSSLTVTNSKLDFDFTADARVTEHTFTEMTLINATGNLKLDVDLAAKNMDTLNARRLACSADSKLHVTALALLKDAAQDVTKINFTSGLQQATQYKGAEELASHAHTYKVGYDKNSGDFTFTKSGASETTKSVSDTAEVVNFAWLGTINNLQKRMGDLRGGVESNMGWARFQRNNDDYKGSRQFNVSGNLYQIGYDFALKNDTNARGYFGVSLDRFDGTQSFKIGNGDIKSTTVSAYYTKMYNSGHYFDFIFRYGRYESDTKSYDATAALYGIATNLEYAVNGVTLSGEYGYRANLGKGGIYFEPQAEFIYGYLSGAKKTSSTNYLADIDSTNHFVTRLGLALGQRVKNFNYYLRASYYHDFLGGTNIKYGTASYKQESAQNWWEVSLGGGWNVSKISYFYAELTKHFKDVSNSLNFNLGFRISM